MVGVFVGKSIGIAVRAFVGVFEGNVVVGAFLGDFVDNFVGANVGVFVGNLVCV